MTYAIANNLKGFPTSSLLVNVIERRDGCAWVVTADLLDAGTPLVLDENQLEAEKVFKVWMHKKGVVEFA